MQTLIAMIRKQRIDIDLKRQQLHRLQQQSSAAEQELRQASERRSQAERYLWLQLSTDGELSLERLNLARRRLQEQQLLCAHSEQEIRRLATEMRPLESAILLDEKKLEKFADVLADRQRDARDEIQRQEWLALDEHILSSRRQRA